MPMHCLLPYAGNTLGPARDIIWRLAGLEDRHTEIDEELPLSELSKKLCACCTEHIFLFEFTQKLSELNN
jgi:hypothetical protein